MDIMVANILKLMQFSMKARKHFLTHIGIRNFCTTKILWFKLDEKVRLNFNKLNLISILVLKKTGEKRDLD